MSRQLLQCELAVTWSSLEATRLPVTQYRAWTCLEYKPQINKTGKAFKFIEKSMLCLLSVSFSLLSHLHNFRNLQTLYRLQLEQLIIEVEDVQKGSSARDRASKRAHLHR